ncbi:hypothetical protein K435DRAFT_662666 [Dendrothele bispora CBS 962.96]|uniref:Rba2 protein n=1 Tax=Dendrothele bispora (strain CBS 962.96) TaxID=1314807 RepID=A0A4S8M5Y4_DENBC|nr:hypothetical protein K435DRAFT_662666 [Dendrothele bispora CBS 962.96]
MSATNPKDDPRDASLERPMRLPNNWYSESGDVFGTAGMFLSGMIMVTRNRYIAWPAILFGIYGVINQHPLRSKEGSGSPWSNLSLCIMALLASYMPMFIVNTRTQATSTPF